MKNKTTGLFLALVLTITISPLYAPATSTANPGLAIGGVTLTASEVAAIGATACAAWEAYNSGCSRNIINPAISAANDTAVAAWTVLAMYGGAPADPREADRDRTFWNLNGAADAAVQALKDAIGKSWNVPELDPDYDDIPQPKESTGPQGQEVVVAPDVEPAVEQVVEPTLEVDESSIEAQSVEEQAEPIDIE